MDWESHYSEVESAYDQVAADYDETIGLGLVSQRAKRLALETIVQISPRGGLLLDIGCYTGTEGLLLAQRGFRVVGIDLSPNMIELCRSKAKHRRLADRTRFEVARASDLSILTASKLGPFDTAYSVYGALNLEPQIQRFKNSILTLLRPRAMLVVGLLNPVVLYELALGPLALRFDGYRKLAKQSVRNRVGRRTVSGTLYTPAELARQLEPEFTLQKVQGVHILYPPPRTSAGARRRGLWWVARAFDRMESAIQDRFPFSHLGRFTLLTLRRFEDAPETTRKE